jgi:hypothetical protein
MSLAAALLMPLAPPTNRVRVPWYEFIEVSDMTKIEGKS